MDFDNRKVYGDTSITDGLVYDEGPKELLIWGVPLTPLPFGRPFPQRSIGRPSVDLGYPIECVFLGTHCSRNPHSMRQVLIGPPKK